MGKNSRGILLALLMAMSALVTAHAADFLTRVQDQGTSFLIGRSGPVFTDFVDPDCPYCHQEFRELQPLLLSGKLRLRIVPVAVLDAGSLPRAATLLESRHPGETFLQAEAGFHNGHLALPRMQNVPPAMASAVERNNQLLEDIDPDGEVPAILFEDRAAGKVASLIGEQPITVMQRALIAAQ
ncbi:thioredoxin fold domain-containing protein [Acidithiobacillus ferrooxidans]|uniref:Thiol:disulfide interchange domain protein n=1 Tax=Acidithiobacillus ferrooxidans (strain ATCC 23270 / DSM 14882 / CIP 104768 / NCIMB 8455) TaxID=243159 RepID=B7J7J3_ACIF2|nr:MULTISPECIES: thioredoxin fold domain-containing protein [Acidithiobacillus]ACK77902.1 thiol:disulfide interchange domain protein [Acidithiobacillus ferrooxidans ATCC 23270]MBN6744185.1 thioredoxin fold domain-containing protein [Acidithiobacillus sp. MC2.2]MBN6746896.1 thioredoxin fold domain-containing protein [Acidithiobacillus sp. PG05]